MSDSHFSGARTVLDRVSMADLLGANGVRLPTGGNRAKCPIHNGDNPTFSYNETKGCWYCHSCGQGGGKVQLIVRLHNCTPKDALAWIARLAGVELQRWTRHEQQRHAAAMRKAETQGHALVEWRDRIIDELREERDVFQFIYHWGIRIGKHEYEAELWERICDYDRRIRWHRVAPWAWLADIFQQIEQRRAA